MRRLVAATMSAFTIAMLSPASAHAQFGGLVRRAAERVVNKDKPGSTQPRLDDAAVTHLLTGLAEEARVADSISRTAMAQNADVGSQVNTFLGRLATYSNARAAAQREQQEYQSCVGGPSQELAAMAQARQGGAPPGAMALAQRMESMSDEEREAFQAKLDKLEKEAKAAEKSGNVAEQQRIRGEVQRLTGMSMEPAPGTSPRSPSDVKKMQDASNRMQKCGTPKPFTAQPPEPIMVRPVVSENGTTRLAASATREIRDSSTAQEYLASLRSMYVGDAPVARGAQAAGMDKGQYALLRERMLYIYANSVMQDAAAHPSGFSDEEYAALESHRSAIISAARRLKQLGAF